MDRDYQFYTRRYLSSKMMMKCQYMYCWYEVFSTLTRMGLRLEILFFARFSLIWQLGWLSEPNLELL